MSFSTFSITFALMRGRELKYALRRKGRRTDKFALMRGRELK